MLNRPFAADSISLTIIGTHNKINRLNIPIRLSVTVNTAVISKALGWCETGITHEQPQL